MTAVSANRGRFLRWLRRVHGWMGLWGAVLGLLFGVTGFLLNHRSVMKIPALQMEQSQFQLLLPAQRPDSPQALAEWLQQELQTGHPALKVSSEPGKLVQWRDRTIPQPAQWRVEFHTLQNSWGADYLIGNSFVSIKRQQANAWGFLMRLHKGVGMDKGWVLLVDSLAGAMVMLALTGVLLWTRMRGSRLTMAGLCGGSLGLALLLVLLSA